ncbi:unnamed protein product [Anisakis simplex]|uniref:DUF19 domain-containing protein n=1 Tax=Anisakis simplex TaxID=6269 RepID=A0A0M3K104_ANISI|nr:unnamed protein product [Anisakis simplex]
MALNTVTKDPVATCRAKYGHVFCEKLEIRCYQKENIPVVKYSPGNLYELPEVIIICMKTELVVDLCSAKYGKEFCTKLKSTCAKMLHISIPADSSNALPEVVIKCISTEYPIAVCITKYGVDVCNKIEKRCYELQSIPFTERQPRTLRKVPLAVAICITTETILDKCISKYDREFCRKLERTCASLLGITLPNGVVRALPAIVVQCITKEHPMATCMAKYGSDFCRATEKRCHELQSIPFIKPPPGTLYELPIAIANCLRSENPMVTCTAKYGSDFCNKVRDRCQKLIGKSVTNNKMNVVYDLPQTITICIASEVTLYSCETKYGSTFCTKLQMTCASMLGIPLPLGGTRNLTPAVAKCIATEHPLATCVAKYGPEFCNKLQDRCYEIQNLRSIKRMPGALFELPQVITSCISSEVTMHSCISKYGRQFCGKLKTVCASMVGTFVSPGPIANLPANVVNCMASEDPIALCIAKYGNEFCQKFKQRCYDAENVFIIDPVPGKSYQLPEAVAACIKSEVVQHTCVSKYGLEFCRNMETACATILHVSARRASSSALSVKVVECISSGQCKSL